MRSSRKSWTIQKRPKIEIDLDVDIDVSGLSNVSPRGRRRLHGFVFGMSALVAAAAATLVGIVVSEIHERRAFDYTSRPLALEALGPVPSLNPSGNGSDGMTVAVTSTHFISDSSPSDSSPPASSPPASSPPDTAPSENSIRTGAPAIAMVGDSWISGSKLDVPFRQALADVGLHHARVKGMGQGGATSRVILQNLVSEDESNAYASRTVIEDGGYEYCLVIAGVNDSATHLGPDFYAHHVTEIARLLLARGVTPLILELPEYGIEAVRAEREGLGLIKDWTLSALFDQGEVDVVEKYRRELTQSLEAAGLMGRIEFIPFDPVVADYHESVDLYADPVHLNDEGRARLTAHLASVVLDLVMHRDRLDGDEPTVRFAVR